MFQTISDLFEPIKVIKDPQSNTVPDMSFTPREIISKFSRGEKVPLGMLGKYDSEDEKENLSKYDPTIFMEDPTRDSEFDNFDYVEEKRALNKRNKEREKTKRSSDEGVSNSKREARSEELSASDATKSETTSGEVETPPNAK